MQGGGDSFQVSYVGGPANNNLTLTAVPGFSINDVALPQASSGTVDYVFTVTLDSPASAALHARLRHGGRYGDGRPGLSGRPGTLSFAPGQTTQTITVHALGNASPEPTKSFRVLLSDQATPTDTEAYGIGTILGTLVGSNYSSVGTDFWVAFPENDDVEFNTNPPILDLFISAQEGATGTVSVPGDGFEQSWTAGVNGVATVTLPVDDEVYTANGVENKGVHIVSDNPVSVYAIDHVQYTTDGYTAIPTPSLGTDYRVMAYENDVTTGAGNYGSRFTVVATVDGTILHITPSATDIKPMPTTVTLNAGQVYQFQDDVNYGSDVTGTQIQSNEPVAVFGGNILAFVPSGAGFADMLIDEMPPVNRWGTTFVTAPLATRDGDTFRVLANQNGTVVDINGQSVATLNAGQYYETILTSPSQITANFPVLVAQYSNGESYDDESGNNGIVGDPFESIVPPVNQFLPEYTLGFGLTPISKSKEDDTYADPGINDNYVNLVVPNSAVGVVRENGTALSASLFTPIGTSGYSFAQIPVQNADPAAAYTFDTPNDNVAFGANVYGFNSYDAYGYPGGFQNSQAASLTLTPATDSPYVGSQASVTATVLDANQQPLVGIPVTFVVAGSNSDTAVVYTNGAGQATLTYRGTVAGTDVVRAIVSQNEASLTASAEKNWLQVVPTIEVDSPSNDSQLTAGSTVLVSGQTAPARRRAGGQRDGQRPARRCARCGGRFLCAGHAPRRVDDVHVPSDRRPGRHGLDHSHSRRCQPERGDRGPIRSHHGREFRGNLLPHVIRRTNEDPLCRPELDQLRTVCPQHAALRGGQEHQRSHGPLARLRRCPRRRDAVLQLQFARFGHAVGSRAQHRDQDDRFLRPEPGPLYVRSSSWWGSPISRRHSNRSRRSRRMSADPTVIEPSPAIRKATALTYSLVAAPAGMTVSGTGLINWTPAAGDEGTYSIVLAAIDANGDQVLQHYILSVTDAPPSAPPLFTSTPNLTAFALTPYQYTATATDQDGDSLSFSVVRRRPVSRSIRQPAS